MWFFGFFVGGVLTYLFKPQLDKGVQKVVKMIRDNRSKKDGSGY